MSSQPVLQCYSVTVLQCNNEPSTSDNVPAAIFLHSPAGGKVPKICTLPTYLFASLPWCPIQWSVEGSYTPINLAIRFLHFTWLEHFVQISPLWNTAVALRGPLAISPPSVNINMCHHSTLLQDTAYYLTYFTTNCSSNDLGNGSFKRGSLSPQDSIFTL